MGDESNHYRTLGLAQTADSDQIKAAFRRLALEHHPDHNGGSAEAEAQFLLVLNAWKVLGDPQTKQRYDRYLADRSPTTAATGPKKAHRPRRRDTAEEVRDSLNSLLWDIEDLVRLGGPLDYQRDLLRILIFLDQWILEPAGLVDYFMDARGLERLSPSSYIDFICQSPSRLTHFPFSSVSGYFYDIRKRMNRYFERLSTVPWLEPIPGRSVRFIDALVESQNLAVHYLSGLRRWNAGEVSQVPRFIPSHPDFH